MKSETIIQVMDRLIGMTEPYGDTAVDEIRYENLERLIDLITYGIEELIENSKYMYSYEYSVKKIGDKAYKSLEELYQTIEYVIK